MSRAWAVVVGPDGRGDRGRDGKVDDDDVCTYDVDETIMGVMMLLVSMVVLVRSMMLPSSSQDTGAQLEVEEEED